jgi:hypothetical protein
VTIHTTGGTPAATTTTLATTLATTPAPGPTPPSGQPALRRSFGAACLPALFLVMIVGTAIQPVDDNADSATTFRQAAGHLGALHVVAWLELLTGVLCIAGLLTVTGAIRGRGAGWATAAGALGVLAGLGQAVISLNHFVVIGLAGTDLTAGQRTAALDAFHQAGGPVVVLFFLLALALPLAGVAAWRAGLASRAILVPALLFLLTATIPGAGVAQFVPLVVGLVLGGWLARALITHG